MKMVKDKDFLSAIAIILISIAILCALVWSLFGPEKKNQEITFKVIGIENYTGNSTTLVSLHYECIKYCAYQFHGDQSARTSCFNQCSTLGKEGCEK